MIAAVLLAAGESKRMGAPKMSLPWVRDRSVIAEMVEIFREGGASPIIVVTGGDRQVVEDSLAGADVHIVHNPNFARGEMLSSVKSGLIAVQEFSVDAVMVCPGDLPLLLADTVCALIERWQRDPQAILVPSYQDRRGHPVVLAKEVWPSILALGEDQTLREYLKKNETSIAYLVVEDPGIRVDIDTPKEYRNALRDAE
ncbi:MAG: NTP transferase domain-containing protein [Anaerolineales bacterium]|nr:NTP transferase domain-containing protein [Anaerolineales bacterium]